MTDHADTIRRVERKYANEVAEAAHRASERDVSTWLAGVSFQEWFDLVAERQQAIDDVKVYREEVRQVTEQMNQAIDEREKAEQRRDAAEQAFDRKCEALRQAVDERDEAQRGWETVKAERDTAQREAKTLQAQRDALQARCEQAIDALREFESLPIRRHTEQTVVMERGPLDHWRAKCGALVSLGETE